MTTTGLSFKVFQGMILCVMQERGRETYQSNKLGVMVRAHDLKRFHTFVVKEYAVHGMLGPVLPRLILNFPSTKSVPEKAIKLWNLDPHADSFFPGLHLEITFTPGEAGAIAAAMPCLIEMVERGEMEDYKPAFGVPMTGNTRQNLWTVTANDMANESVIENGSLRRK